MIRIFKLQEEDITAAPAAPATEGTPTEEVPAAPATEGTPGM